MYLTKSENNINLHSSICKCNFSLTCIYNVKNALLHYISTFKLTVKNINLYYKGRFHGLQDEHEQRVNGRQRCYCPSVRRKANKT